MCELKEWRDREMSVDCTVFKTDLSSGSNGAGTDASILRQLLAQFIVLFLQRSSFGLTEGRGRETKREGERETERERERRGERKGERE